MTLHFAPANPQQAKLQFCISYSLNFYENFQKNLKIKIYRTTVLPVVLYGCRTWSLTFRGESWLMVSENRVLRRIFEPKRDEEKIK